MELNQKTEILSSKQGFDFLGFRYYIKNGKVIMKIKNQMKRRIKRKFKSLNKQLNNEKITKEHYLQVENSYVAHLSYGNCKKFVKNTIIKYHTNIDKVGMFIHIGDDGEVVYDE